MKKLIFTLAGISLLDKNKGLLGTGANFEDNLRHIQNCQNIDAIIEKNNILGNLKKEVLNALKNKSLLNNFTQFSAEISSLHKLEALSNEDDKIIFLVTQTPDCALSTTINGKFIIYKRANNEDWDSITFKKSGDTFVCVNNVEIKIIDGLQTKYGKIFASQGIENLFSFVSNVMEKEAPFYDEIILNITGGFKGVVPYLTLFGMLYQEREIKGRKIKPLIKYLYEESRDIITLPNLPIDFDLPTWRDYRGLIMAIESLRKEQADIILEKVLPPQISGLFDPQDSKQKLNPFGVALKDRYRKEKISLTPFGRGHLLLDKIKDTQLRSYLKGCVDHWQHLWIGDKIPEMAEHQRGHTQRVLEFAAELLYPIFEENENFLNDAELSSLIGAIWLHDLGHSGERFKINNQEYIVKGFPSLIRDFHNLITATILEEENQKLFPEKVEIEDKQIIQKDNLSNIGALIKNIVTISRYHRKWTPLTPGVFYSKNMHCIELKEAVKDDRIRFLAALYRVLDACDTQLERAVDEAYINMRKMIVDWEVKILIGKKKKLESNDHDGEINNFITSFNRTSFGKCLNIDLNLLGGDLDWIFGEYRNAEKQIDEYADCINQIVGQIITSNKTTVPKRVEDWFSYLDQIFFKKRQPCHYEKHMGIPAVMILSEGKEDQVYKFDVRMIGAESTDAQKLKDVLEKDIVEEYIEAKEALNSYLKFKFTYQLSDQRPETYQDYK
ncbi:MAG: hypothetical protein DDT23_01136 [candidate division WS2 bacterium]|nr:hypothetical protein [Candidatus Lithacetigena glycinireducens]